MRRAYLTAAVLLSACYRYSASPAPTPDAGTHVRFTLADSSLVALERVLGERTIAVEGLVLATTDSVYMMNVTATMKKGIAGDRPNRVVWAGDSVSIPRAAVTGVELRSLDRGKTTRAIAIGAVVVAVTAKLVISAVSGGYGGDDGGPIVTPP
jgi:hypothetical protein